MYKTIERPAFSAAQKGLFPIYFGLQTVLPAILALIFPGNALVGISSSILGLFDEAVRWSSLAPIVTMFLGGLTNLVVLLPATLKVMKERRGQGILLVCSGPVLKRGLMLRGSQAGREGMVRRGASLGRDAGPKQAIWDVAWSFFPYQPRDICFSTRLWIYPGCSHANHRRQACLRAASSLQSRCLNRYVSIALSMPNKTPSDSQ